VRISWPFQGRGEELERIRALLADSGARGLLLAGQAGVGKSRLAAEALAGVDRPDGRLAVVRVVATAGARELPYGAFAHLLPVAEAAAATGNALGWAARSVTAAARGRRLVVSVDDAHLLDPSSAALVLRLVRGREAFVLATLRTGEQVPEAVAALDSEGLLPRIDVGPLAEEEVARLVGAALAGPVDAWTVRRLHALSQGNALFLRELLVSGLESGRLVRTDGRWHWQGDLAPSARLAELIGARLGDLDGPAREVVELVALAEPAPSAVVARVASTGAVKEAVRRQLLRVVPEGRRELLRLAHPLYAEQVRAGCPRSRALRHYRSLADAMAAGGARRSEDVLRLAVWRLDSGTADDPGPLLEACGLAWAGHDHGLAVRLGEAAVAAGGGVRASVLLARLLLHSGAMERAEPVLAEAWRQARTGVERGQLAIMKYNVLAGLDRHAEADRLLAEVTPTLDDPEILAGLATARALVSALRGDCATAVEAVRRVLGDPAATPANTAQAHTAHALVQMFSGRRAAALAEAEETIGGVASWRNAAPFLRTLLMVAREMAHRVRGELADAQRVLDAEEAAGVLQDWPAAFILARAEQAGVRRTRGELTAACASADLSGFPPSRWLLPCYVEFALAAAMAGDAAGAARSLALADAHPSGFFGLFLGWVDIGRCWVMAASGDVAGAVRTALRAGEQARAAGLHTYEAEALHSAVRLGGADPAVAARLAELRSLTDGPTAELYAAHARAAADGDGPGLKVVAEGFERLGMVLHAAECFAQSAASGAPGGAAAAARARELAARSGARTPALVWLRTPGLTPREREIAGLAAAGLTSRLIAQRLRLSVRTVDNHLTAIYAKLGVRGRAELTAALARAEDG
jgi:DNA-binding CsgD family transcriptional regulator